MRKMLVLTAVAMMVMAVFLAGCAKTVAESAGADATLEAKDAQIKGELSGEGAAVAGQATKTEIASCSKNAACKKEYTICYNANCDSIRKEYSVYYAANIKGKKPVSSTTWKGYTDFKTNLERCGDKCYNGALAKTIYAVIEGPILISECGKISESGIYQLTQDLEIPEGGSNLCFDLSVSGITFDCAGHKISFKNQGIGFLVNKDNTVIKNCVVEMLIGDPGISVITPLTDLTLINDEMSKVSCALPTTIKGSGNAIKLFDGACKPTPEALKYSK